MPRVASARTASAAVRNSLLADCVVVRLRRLRSYVVATMEKQKPSFGVTYNTVAGLDEHNKLRHTISQCVSSSGLEAQITMTYNNQHFQCSAFHSQQYKTTFLKCFVSNQDDSRHWLDPQHYCGDTIQWRNHHVFQSLNWESTFTPFHHLTQICSNTLVDEKKETFLLIFVH